VIVRSIAALGALTDALNDPDISEDNFEAMVAAAMSNDDLGSFFQSSRSSEKQMEEAMDNVTPVDAAKRLQDILETHIPSFTGKASTIFRRNRRPSLFIRYWIPAVVVLVSCTLFKTQPVDSWQLG